MNSRCPNVWIVIAAYNEASVIAEVLAEVQSTGHHILVVDDGSTDATADIAANARAIVIKHIVNLGQGAALQTGIDYALLHGADIIVTFDADGQHRARDIRSLIEALREHDAEFALGSRFLGKTLNMPLSRQILLKGATWFTRLMTGLQITDSHNGLRAISRSGARTLRLTQNHMAHASELLHQIARSGLKYVEVPSTIEYSRYSLAKGQRLRGSIAILVDLFVRSLRQ
jgi:glycosyltransferase involved in cell wall biosynthesis